MSVSSAIDLDMCEVPMVDPDRVAAVRERLLEREEADRLAEWFKVLADPTRIRALYALLEAGELCVCDLAASIDVPESTVSHALRWMRSAGAVRVRRSGRMAYYSLDDAHVRLLLDLGRQHLGHLGQPGHLGHLGRLGQPGAATDGLA